MGSAAISSALVTEACRVRRKTARSRGGGLRGDGRQGVARGCLLLMANLSAKYETGPFSG